MSAGLSGSVPLVRTCRFGTAVGCRVGVRGVAPPKRFESPSLFGKLNRRCCAGRRKSASTMTTRMPAWANAIPRQAMASDFPSSAPALVMRI